MIPAQFDFSGRPETVREQRTSHTILSIDMLEEMLGLKPHHIRIHSLRQNARNPNEVILQLDSDHLPEGPVMLQTRTFADCEPARVLIDVQPALKTVC